MTSDRRPTNAPPQREIFERALAATARALSGAEELEVRFTADSASLYGTTLALPTPPDDLAGPKTASLRGKADALCLKLAHHDRAGHQAARPTGPKASAIHDAAEQARIEALGACAMKGVAGNLDAALDEACERKGYPRMEDRQDAPLADAVSFLIRERMTGRPLPPSAQGVADLWREIVEDKAGEALTRACEKAGDQAAFAEALRDVIRDLDLGEELGRDSEEDTPEEENDEEDNTQDQGPEEDEEDDSEGDAEAQTEQSGAADAAENGLQEVSSYADGSMEETETEGEGSPAEAPAGPRPRTNADIDNASVDYDVFTSEFDEVKGADELADPAELDRLRSYLDQQLSSYDGVVARLANRLQRRLLAKQTRSWTFDLDEGVLDAARLTRVVTDPLGPLSFKQETETDFRDTVVTLLLDNSGSMRGRPIVMAAMCADILARTLERCAVKVEILGFTTRAWKGGRSKEKWLKSGRPAAPGRLNDLRHIIYKPADAPYRRSRRHLGLMMREGILKENIDGEALVWAWRRLMARPEQRRILMVISDGAPVDDATNSVNNSSYLDRHLRQVIAHIESRSEVELTAIGIGHDVTKWYKRAVTLTDADQLGGAVMAELADLFDEAR